MHKSVSVTKVFVLSKTFSRTCANWQNRNGMFCLWRSFSSSKTSLAEETSTTNKSEVDVAKVVDDYNKTVDETKLSKVEMQIHKTHMNALQRRKLYYNDPVTNFEVFTVLAHLERGYCCGNACRHCAYNYRNVEQRYKDLKTHNTAFYN